MTSNDGELSCIHGGLTNGGETMVAKRKHVQLLEMSTVTGTNFKKMGIPPILSFKEDRLGLHFIHDDALVI